MATVAEFTIEPFVEGEPGPHVRAAIEVAEAAGGRNLARAKAVVWGDYDADGLPDLYVSNFGQANRFPPRKRNYARSRITSRMTSITCT